MQCEADQDWLVGPLEEHNTFGLSGSHVLLLLQISLPPEWVSLGVQNFY
jgi:hypothetical protein